MVRAICMCIFCRYNSIYGGWRRKRKEEPEKIPIVGEGYHGGTTYLEVSPPAFHIKNRMLSKK